MRLQKYVQDSVIQAIGLPQITFPTDQIFKYPERGVSRHHTTRYVLQYEVVLRLAPLKCGYVGCWRQAGIAAVNNVW